MYDVSDENSLRQMLHKFANEDMSLDEIEDNISQYSDDKFSIYDNSGIGFCGDEEFSYGKIISKEDTLYLIYYDYKNNKIVKELINEGLLRKIGIRRHFSVCISDDVDYKLDKAELRLRYS